MLVSFGCGDRLWLAGNDLYASADGKLRPCSRSRSVPMHPVAGRELLLAQTKRAAGHSGLWFSSRPAHVGAVSGLASRSERAAPVERSFA